jgi:hypothetical protein
MLAVNQSTWVDRLASALSNIVGAPAIQCWQSLKGVNEPLVYSDTAA